MFDVVIIGAGVTGSAIAREVSRYKLNTCVIEKEEDVCNETSKANSAIIHAGFDAVPGTSPRARRPCSSRRAASAFSPGRPRMCRTACRSATSGSMFCPIRSGSARCAAPCAVMPASSSSPSSAPSSSYAWRLCCTMSWRRSIARAWTLTR